VFSQRVLLALVDHGMTRDAAYEVVQGHAMATWREGGSFRQRLEGDPRVGAHLDAAALDALFDAAYYVRHADAVYERVLGEGVVSEALS